MTRRAEESVRVVDCAALVHPTGLLGSLFACALLVAGPVAAGGRTDMDAATVRVVCLAADVRTAPVAAALRTELRATLAAAAPNEAVPAEFP